MFNKKNNNNNFDFFIKNNFKSAGLSFDEFLLSDTVVGSFYCLKFNLFTKYYKIQVQRLSY